MSESPISWHVPLAEIEKVLQKVLLRALTCSSELAELAQAMNYGALSGGKRLRARLVLETAIAVRGANDQTWDAGEFMTAACAVELIHAYSLVHDDLPSMDNAMMRRGQPSCHRKFGVAQAILTGDALLNLAYEILFDQATTSAHIAAARILAKAAGVAGMVGGQYEDISWSAAGAMVDSDQLLAMQARKTGALISAAVESGAALGGASKQQQEGLRQYGIHLGKAFQLRDDLLDVEGDPSITGKEQTDQNNDKITAPFVLGIDQTRRLVTESSELAVGSLATLGESANTLQQLAQFAATRKK